MGNSMSDERCQIIQEPIDQLLLNQYKAFF
jgi:hypothetical protein